jgi:hypothetical protein
MTMTDENAPRRPIAEEIAEAAEREEIDLNLAAIERQMLRDHAEAVVKQAAELGSAIFNRLAGELQEASHGGSPILADRAYAERDKLAMEVRWQGRAKRQIRFTVVRSTGQLQVYALTDVEGHLLLATDPARVIDPLDPEAEDELVGSVSWVWDPGDRAWP